MSKSAGRPAKVARLLVRRARPLLLAWLALVSAASCIYGPPRLTWLIENMRRKPGTAVWAVAVHYDYYRPAVGINAFPDGGRPKTIAEGAELFLCDTQRREITFLARIERPASMRTAFSAWVGMWENDSFYLQLHGYPGLESTVGTENVEYLRVALNGEYERVEGMPRISGPAVSQPSYCYDEIRALGPLRIASFTEQ